MSTNRQSISLQPEVLRWARGRVGLDQQALAKKAKVQPAHVTEWEETGKISIAGAVNLARATYTPLGLLYLAEPPYDLDRLTIPDFRTPNRKTPANPSPNLIDTVHSMQRRQAWMREELMNDGVDPLPFVGAFNLQHQPKEVAAAVKQELKLSDDWAAKYTSWEGAFRRLRDHVEAVGILIVINGVVGNNGYRPLDRKEFQGFALTDNYAPLIFINNKDYKAAQMFTLAHELAHVFVNESGLSKFKSLLPTEHETERFCDRVAAEFLVPSDKLRTFAKQNPGTPDYEQIARQFKVSSIVAARRALDTKLINKDAFFEFYNEVKKGWDHDAQREGRGDFWNNQNGRIGRRFGNAIKHAVGEGRLLYRDAYALTGLSSKTFDKFLTK